jgi:hypothetical protein
MNSACIFKRVATVCPLLRGRHFDTSKEVSIMRKNSFHIIAAFAACVAITPAWAAGHGAGGSGHGATVSAAAMAARQGDQPVGASVRTVARSNSQGALHANANAISHVQGSKGQANANSVLGSGGAATTTSTSLKTTGKAKGRSIH